MEPDKAAPAANSRRYHPDDLAACLEVFDSNVPRFFSTGERTEFVGFLSELPGPYLVFFDAAGRVHACGGWALREDGVTADLCWGMVRQDLHRRGWGRTLVLERLRAIEVSPAVRRIELQTSQHTREFYEHLDFEAVTVDPDGFAPGLDRIVMIRTVQR